MFHLYASGYSDEPAVRLVDMNWVRYSETRYAALEIVGAADQDFPNAMGATIITLSPLDESASYLSSNNKALIRFSADGVTYGGWGESIAVPDFAPGSGYLDIQVQNPNYEGTRGYATWSLHVEGRDTYHGRVVTWGDAPWGAFVWAHCELKRGLLSTADEPFVVRAFLMDQGLQALYEAVGISFEET